MKHEPVEHEEYDIICCKNCGLTEGAFTTDCPGVPSDENHGEAVFHGRRDFRDGKWTNETSPHSYMHDQKARIKKRQEALKTLQMLAQQYADSIPELRQALDEILPAISYQLP